MTVFKNNILFINRQIDQIREGGARVLHKKAKKTLWLLFMNVVAPPSVYFKVSQTKPYFFMGKKSLKRLKKLYARTNPDESAIKEVMGQAVKYFKAVVDRDPASENRPDWIFASRALGDIYFIQGKTGEMNELFRKEAEILQRTIKEDQFDDLEMEFLPRFLGVSSIGTYEFLDVHVKSGILGLRPPRKSILLIDAKATVNNPCYLNYWRRYITVISDPVLVRMLSPLQKRFGIPLNLYMLLQDRVYKGFLALGIVRQQWVKDKRPPLLTLLDEDYKRGWQCLKSFGMKQDDWFVCLHVRERGWKDNNSPVEDFRNADVDTYIPAIKAITDAGGWVVRMGDPTMKPLTEMTHVIDYAHSDAKSDWMDVFLCAQGRFFVGTSSGLFIFAMAFGTPVVATNFLPTCCAYYLTSNDLFIPRVCKFKGEERFMDFKELFSPRIGMAAIQSTYDSENVEVVNNTKEEIKELVEEMLGQCRGGFSCSEEDEEMQRLFKSVTADCGRLYGPENAVVNAAIGKKFLRKYAGLLPSRKEAAAVSDVN